MTTNIYIVNFNPSGQCGLNSSYFVDDEFNNIPFTDFDSADKCMRNEISDFTNRNNGYEFDPEYTISRITHYVVGEPTTKLESIIKKNGFVTITYGPNGDISKYELYGNGRMEWTPKELTPYDNKFKCGDIVDCSKNGKYLGRYVIVDTPRLLSEYVDEMDINKDPFFISGYWLFGNNPYNTDKMYFEFDIDGVYDEDLSPAKGILYPEFYDGISIYGKCFDRRFDKHRPKMPAYLDQLFEIYFKDKDYTKFNNLVEEMKKVLNDLNKVTPNE